MKTPILRATLVAGTLDILSAFVFAGIAGIGPVAVLNYVASGPFGDAALHGAGWAAVGLLTHYAIMACMVTAYMIAAARLPWSRQTLHPQRCRVRLSAVGLHVLDREAASLAAGAVAAYALRDQQRPVLVLHPGRDPDRVHRRALGVWARL